MHDQTKTTVILAMFVPPRGPEISRIDKQNIGPTPHRPAKAHSHSGKIPILGDPSTTVLRTMADWRPQRKNPPRRRAVFGRNIKQDRQHQPGTRMPSPAATFGARCREGRDAKENSKARWIERASVSVSQDAQPKNKRKRGLRSNSWKKPTCCAVRAKKNTNAAGRRPAARNRRARTSFVEVASGCSPGFLPAASASTAAAWCWSFL